VGFPGETPELFRQTLDFVTTIPFSNIHVFPFSAREGTRARSFPAQVPDTIRSERVAALRELAAGKREAFARQWIGLETEVLVEECDAQGYARGWTGEYLPACLRTPPIPKNQIIRFSVQSVDETTLLGENTSSTWTTP
jgi:threonylcarbamoyladenosine tRNA methylthiotransferase MtaB